MTPNDAKRANTEPEVPQTTSAPNPSPDAEMTSVEQPIPFDEGSELSTKTESIPMGSDYTQMTQDQLTSITDSVWQRIGH